MSRLVSIDGVLFAPDQAKVSVYDRGFLYGDSVFETLRTYRGVPFAMNEHMERLERSADRVAIEMPISKEEIAGEVRRAIVAADNTESTARIMLTRGVGPLGLDPSLAGPPLRVVFVEPLKAPPPDFYRRGVAAVTYRTERAADAARGAKVGNYLASVLAVRAAQAAGSHEALILDSAGRVSEGTTSNVFIVRGGKLITPPDEAAILPGITRAHLLEVAAEQGIAVDLSPIPLAELFAADEVFISSSVREVVPVVRVDGHTIGTGSPGVLTRTLHAAFRRHVGVGDAPMPWE